MLIKFDVAVIGGGQPGVCAAISAAENGSKVILIHDRTVLGGNISSEGCVPAHGAETLGHNRNLRDTGILENLRLDFYCKYAKDSDLVPYWDILLQDRCDQTDNLTVKLHTRVFDVGMEGSRIATVKALDLATNEILTIQADVFIDDTGDGTLGYMAGAEYRKGRESRDEFKERLLGKEKADSHTLGCSIYGWAVKRGYQAKFTPPEWAVKYLDCDSIKHRDHDIHSIFPTVTCSKDHGEIVFFWWLEWGGELDVITQQDEIYKHLKAEMFGLWDHLKNHCSEETTHALENFELFKWSLFPLKRESRRLMGDYIITENDLIHGTIFEDEIGYGGWPMDDHPPMGIASKEPPCDQFFLSQPYSVPFRSCYSKNIENLLMVGRCMSTTHAALSSIRVVNTLSAIAEAVGIAASMCSENGITPRILCQTRIGELQNKILMRDLFLLGKQGSVIEDKASFCVVTVSSEAKLHGTDSVVDYMELRYDIALQIPVTRDVSSLSVRLKADKDSCVDYRILFGKKLGQKMSDTELARGALAVKKGEGFYELADSGLKIEDFGIITVILSSNVGVFWVYGKEVEGTRWGVNFTGDMNGIVYHGKSYLVNEGNPWIWINNHGRMPAEIAQWTRTLKGYKRHDKLFATPCFKIEPEQCPYGAKNLTNGITRSYDQPNLWVSEEGLPQTATLTWNVPVYAKTLEIVFDTNLDYSDQRYGFPRTADDYSFPNVIEETVSDYNLKVTFESGKSVTKEIQNNLYRRNVHQIETEEKIKEVQLTVLGTKGVSKARVFEIRAY